MPVLFDLFILSNFNSKNISTLLISLKKFRFD